VSSSNGITDRIAPKDEAQTRWLRLFDLTGKTAIVTGAARGLGRAMALALAGAGAGVCVADRNADGAAQVAGEIQAMGRPSLALRCEVADATSVQSMVEATAGALGGVDILVNNAGINRGGEFPPERLSQEIWDDVLQVNLTGVFLSAQAAGRWMIERGRPGKIINMASISGLVVNRLTDRHPLPYCVSKAGVIMLTKVLAVEWAKHHINVNAIAPTYFRTEMIHPDPNIRAEMVRDTPMHRLGEPYDLAGSVLYLASSASDFVTGHTLFVDGGYTAW
jgi:NAD(P)-dependent dehydrogenase (short-subunit alcohol dehydrogenase family)